ncbi:cytochrome b/b6 domain-containing protein [Salmonella enterica subsp. enterica serovar Newport]|nr:cytochrome b/b6 domain-containing protein [Salmonella enterica subsp. enterica serovar Newport]MJR82403.1 cytochrome b/b6 domain-containing protein [Salmonella enterica subsp. enterica serovar Newport]HAE2415353.1 cytochrome b/b6 domain-containing protein [Salmonella enterica subsp. enterica serovar Newport]
MLKKIWEQLPHPEFPGFRILHILIAGLILSQIINSGFTSTEALKQSGTSNTVIWIHIISGMGLLILGSIMLFWMLTRRGIRYYFAWLFWDFRGIKDDLLVLKGYRLPGAHEGGIASTVQGLGGLSLLAVALSGATWFALDYLALVPTINTERVISLHKFLTTFIEIYFFAHGAMGILHRVLNYRGITGPG